jgi:O-antigen/teichoic acid export membrane protein
MFQKRLRFDFWTKSLGVGSIVSFLLVGFFVLRGYSLQFSVLSLVIGNFVSVILSLVYVRIKVFPVSFNTKVAKNFISKSFPLGLMLIFNLIYFRIDSLILSSFKSASDVGIYGLSYLFFDVLLSIPLFVSNSIYPILLSHKENKNLFMSFARSYFFIYLGLSLVIILPFWFVSPLLSLIKPELSKAVLPFHILLLGLPFFFLTSFFQWILITFNKTKFLMAVYFVSMIINIVLNFILVFYFLLLHFYFPFFI